MNWNEKYWDAILNIFWTPKYIGLESIPKKHWLQTDGAISIPSQLVPAGNSIYTRRTKGRDIRGYLETQEEILNHVFDITFAITADSIIEEFFLAPFGFRDAGPFTSIGREVRQRYGWGDEENVTQQDGLFVSANSILSVELKLGAKTSLEQIVKYASLMAWEEIRFGPRENIGLLFIVPESAIAKHWTDAGLSDGWIGADALTRLEGIKFPRRVRELMSADTPRLVSILERLELRVISWREFNGMIAQAQSNLQSNTAGDATLRKLLGGLAAQVEQHQGTEA